MDGLRLRRLPLGMPANDGTGKASGSRRQSQEWAHVVGDRPGASAHGAVMVLVVWQGRQPRARASVASVAHLAATRLVGHGCRLQWLSAYADAASRRVCFLDPGQRER